MKPSYVICFSTLALALSQPARAHHGRDFLLVQDYSIPAPRDGHLVAGFDWSDEGDDDEFGFEPGFSLGLMPRLSVGTTLHFGGGALDDIDIDEVAPSLQVQLTPPDANFPIRLALFAGYAFANHGEADTEHGGHDDEHEHADEHAESTHDDVLRAGDDDGHTHSGIHAHGTSGLRVRLVADTDLTESLKFAANFISVVPEDGDAVWGYAVGLRHSFNHDLAIGAEAMGDFDGNGHHEVLGAVYWSPCQPVLIKLGVGTGLTAEGPDLAVRGGCVWSF